MSHVMTGGSGTDGEEVQEEKEKEERTTVHSKEKRVEGKMRWRREGNGREER